MKYRQIPGLNPLHAEFEPDQADSRFFTVSAADSLEGDVFDGK
jgi:hypothetical protein